MADEVEANPDKFMRLKYGTHLDQCRKRVARLIGADVDGCVLVPNAIHGINTVLRNLEWKKGDVIIKSRVQVSFV
jgi:hercynylcysteine S-oxide lyase